MSQSGQITRMFEAEDQDREPSKASALFQMYIAGWGIVAAVAILLWTYAYITHPELVLVDETIVWPQSLWYIDAAGLMAAIYFGVGGAVFGVFGTYYFAQRGLTEWQEAGSNN